ncbi:MAG: family 16 glycosylhydrolase [Cellvibrio sp.]|uniref:family 16 glycosylhydrolase n=1 Tax=Cellvibrio sp. TaxID=1965322 RepID=UPI00271EB263|nr:family 16 glycosylhydrolase [Cellvibrio sp.]
MRFHYYTSLAKGLGRLAIAASTFLAVSGYTATQCQNPSPIWADEFNGTAVDTSKWEFQNGDGCSYGICGWGNNELQSYQSANATVANGLLTITAKKQRVGSKAYTSSRIRTLNMPNGGQWKNGRFEARVKVPRGAGMWPAFWMLPANTNVGWPMSGEIDILEATGQANMIAFGTLHYGQAWPNNQWTSGRILKQPDTWSDNFHTYAVEWEPNVIRWYIDDLLYSTKTPADLGNPAYWTFEDFQYYMILNLAIGGNLGGPVDESMLPQTMQVDYVRVYNYGKPNLSGKHLVEPNTSATYSVIDEAGTNSSYSWTSPTGQTSTGKSLTVNWGTLGGPVTARVTNSCGSYNLSLNVHVAPTLSKADVHDDFETNRNLAYTSWTGNLNQASANPSPIGVNTSSLVASYVRSSSSQYDVISGTTSLIPNASAFVSGSKAFYLDVYTDAPVGTEMLVQLESSTATASNFPTGRHSRYIAHTTAQNSWQRVKFLMDDRIDGTTADTAVSKIVLLLAPNTFTGHTYYLDNFSTYAEGTAPAPATSMSVSGVTTGTASAGKGTKYATAAVTVLDNNNNPVANATVTGNFSGTINQTGVSGKTGSDGKITLQTSSAAGGALVVNFCVSALSHASLSHNTANSSGLCP